jgi:histo-blood group ABO system transferase
MQYRIGLLVIATQKYIQFVPGLHESVLQHFLKGHKVTLFVFTNGTPPSGTVRIPYEHRPWPHSTLMRYHAFSSQRDLLSQMDYLYYCDADMRFVADVGEEILGSLVATVHPGFYDKMPDDFTYERRKESTAFVGPGEGSRYFAGGFNGGLTDRFLSMAEDIARRIDIDSSNGIVALWHDESHLNRYLLDHPPTKILSPSYCYPESAAWAPPFPPKLVALEKDHAVMRETASSAPATPLRHTVKPWVKKAVQGPFRLFGLEVRRIRAT